LPLFDNPTNESFNRNILPYGKYQHISLQNLNSEFTYRKSVLDAFHSGSTVWPKLKHVLIIKVNNYSRNKKKL
jgi:hypothetical protein